MTAFVRSRRQPVRVLHPWHPVPAGRARAGARGRAGRDRRCWPICAAVPAGGRSWRRPAIAVRSPGAPGACRPPPEGSAPVDRGSRPPARPARSPRQPDRCPDRLASTGRARRASAARRATLEGGTSQRTGAEVVLGGGGFAGDTAPRMPGRRARRWRWMGRRGDPRRGPGGFGSGPGASQRTGTALPARGAARRLGRRPPDHLGGAGLPRAGRVVVPARRRAGPSRRQWRGLRRKGRLAGSAPRPGLWPSGTVGRCEVVFSREDVVRLGPKRPPMAAGLRSRRHRADSGGGRPGDRGVDPAGGAGRRGRGGRGRGRPPGVDRHPGRGMGRGGRAAGCRPGRSPRVMSLPER